MPVDIPNTTRSGDQPLLIEVTFPDESGDTEGEVLSRDFVESFQITVVDRGSWTGQLVLFDRTGDFILSLLSRAGFGHLVRLRWGWDDEFGIERYPSYFGEWVNFQPEFTAEGVRITFELLPLDAAAQAVTKNAEPRTFSKGTEITRIVQRIANARGWATVDSFGRSTIQQQPDVVLTEELVKDARLTDYEFILGELIQRMAPKRGGPWYFYLDLYNTVHFHQAAPVDDPNDIRVRYRFGQDIMGSVIEFAPSDARFYAALVGGSSAIYRGVDSLTGKRLRLASTDLGGLAGIKELVDAGGEHLTPIPATERSEQTAPAAVRGVVARSEKDFVRKVQRHFVKQRREAYPATLVVRGTHAVLPLTTIEVEYIASLREKIGANDRTNAQFTHFLSGAFQVHGIEHEVGSSGWQTRFDLRRVGVVGSAGTSAILNADKRKSPKRTEDAGVIVVEATASKAQVRVVSKPVRPGAP